MILYKHDWSLLLSLAAKLALSGFGYSKLIPLFVMILQKEEMQQKYTNDNLTRRKYNTITEQLVKLISKAA